MDYPHIQSPTAIRCCSNARIDTYLYVYQNTGTSGHLLGNLVTYCDDCGPCGLQTVLSSWLNAGNYVVVMDGFATSNGAYRMAVTCPTQSVTLPNDGTVSCTASATGSTVGGATYVGHAAPERWCGAAHLSRLLDRMKTTRALPTHNVHM